MLLAALLYSVVYPFLVSTSLLSIGLWSQRRRRHDEQSGQKRDQRGGESAGWSGAVAMSAAYLICHLGIHGWPASAKLEAWEWLLLLAPTAGLLGVVESFVTLPRWTRLAAAIVLSVATGWLIVPTFAEQQWAWRLAIGSTVLALLLSQRSQSRHLVGIALPVTWILVGSCGLPVLIASANAKFGFFSTSVAAAAGATFVMWLIRRDVQTAQGAIPVVSVLYPSIFFSGNFNDYGDVPLTSFALLAFSPIGLWIGVPCFSWQSRTWKAPAIGIALVIAVCATSMFLAWPALTAEPAY